MLIGVAPLGAVSHRFNFNLNIIKIEAIMNISGLVLIKEKESKQGSQY